jgi:hypothetical protein
LLLIPFANFNGFDSSETGDVGIGEASTTDWVDKKTQVAISIKKKLRNFFILISFSA